MATKSAFKIDGEINLSKFFSEFQKLASDGKQLFSDLERDITLSIKSGDAKRELAELAKQGLENIKSTDRLADEWNNARAQIEASAKKASAALSKLALDGKRDTDQFKKLETQLREDAKALEEMNEISREFGQTSEENNNKFLEIFAKAQILGEFGSFLEGLSAKGQEVRKSLLEVQGQTGATAEKLDEIRASAESLFSAGVGESLAEAIKIRGSGEQLLGNFLSGEEIDKFLPKAAAIGQIFEKDVNEVIGKSRTLIANFGLDGEQAGNFLALAMQKGGTAMDDVLDTMDEYSQLAVQMGFNTEEWLGSLLAGAEAGSRDLDKIADSAKEAQIRLKAGDTTRALADIASPITETIQGIITAGEQGKLSVKDVLSQTTQEIESAFNAGQISESIRTQLQVAIAGTPAEDIGSDVYARVFGAPIPAETIRAQAEKAGQQVTKAIEPISFFAKAEKEIEKFASKGGAVIASVVGGAGSLLQTVAQVGPGVTLLADKFDDLGGKAGILAKLKNFLPTETFAKAADLIKGRVLPAILSMIPGYVGTGAAATSAGAASVAAGTASGTAWTAALGPVGLIIAGIVALGAALYFLLSPIDEVRAFIVGAFEYIKTYVLGIAEGIVKLLTFDFSGAFDSFFGAGEEAAAAYEKGFNESIANAEFEGLQDALEDLPDLTEDIQEINIELNATNNFDQLVGQFEKATDPIVKAELGKRLAEQFPDAFNSLDRMKLASGDLADLQQVNIDKAKEYNAELRKGAQDDIADESLEYVQALRAQGLEAEKQQKVLEELQEKRRRLSAAGVDTTDIDKQVADAEKAAAESKAAFEQTYRQGVELNVFKNLGPEAKEEFGKVEVEAGRLLKGINLEDAALQVGESIGKAIDLKGRIDANDGLDDLVKRFKETTDEVEKRNLASVLAEKYPDAIEGVRSFTNELGEPIEVYDINISKVEDFAAANKKALTKDSKDAQETYKKGLNEMAGAVLSAQDRVEQLQKKITETGKNGGDVQPLVEELEKAKKEVTETEKKFGDLARKGGEVGLIEGDITQVGQALGRSKEESDRLARSVQRVKKETDQAKKSAADLAAEYQKVREGLDSTVNTNIDAIAQLERDIADLQKQKVAAGSDAERIRIQRDIDLKVAEKGRLEKEAQTAQKERAAEEGRTRRIRIRVGVEKPDKPDVVEFTDSLQDLIDETADVNATVDLSQISDESKREQQEIARAAEERRKQARQSLADLNEQIDEAVKDGKIVEIEIGGETIRNPNAARKALSEATGELLAAIDREEKQKLDELEKRRQERLLNDARKLVKEDLALQADAASATLDQLRADEEAVTGETVSAVRRRYDLRRQIADREREQEVAAELAKDEELEKIRARLLLAQKAGDSTLVEQLKREEAARVDVLQTTNARLLLLDRKDARRRAQLTADEEKDVRRAEFQEQIATEQSYRKQQYLLALRDLKDRLADELAAADGNEAKKLALIEQYEEDAANLRREFLEDDNALYALSLDFKEKLLTKFFERFQQKREEDLEKERAYQEQQLQLLQDRFDAGLIQYKEYVESIQGLEDEQQDAAAETFSIRNILNEALGEAGAAAAERQAEEIDKMLNKEQLTSEERLEILARTGAQMASLTAKYAAEGQKLTTAAANAAIDATLTTLLANEAAFLFGMFGSSVEQLGPILGPLAFIGVAATLTTLAGIAKSALTGAKAQFARGGVDIGGPGTGTSDSIDARISRGESVMTAKSTGAGSGRFSNKEAYIWANRTGRPLWDFYRDLYRGEAETWFRDLLARANQQIEIPKPASLVGTERYRIVTGGPDEHARERIAEMSSGMAALQETVKALQEGLEQRERERLERERNRQFEEDHKGPQRVEVVNLRGLPEGPIR